MKRSGMQRYWNSLVGAARAVLERIMVFTNGSAWFRFLMIPLMALLLWAISVPISAALSKVVEFLANDAPSKLDQLIQSIKILIFGLPPPFFPTTPLPATPPPAPDFSTQAWNWLSEVGRDKIQIVLLLAVSMWTAYRLMIHFVLYVYEIDDFRHAARIVESAFLPFKRRIAVIQNEMEITNREISVQEMVGGRSAFTLDAYKGYAAVMERPGSFTRVVGPQDRFPVNLDGFTHLRDVIDLRDQRLMVTATGHTKDGIPLKAYDWSFTCRLAGSVLSSPQKNFLSCDRNSVHKLVYRHWISQDWKNRSKRHIALTDLVSTALREFISEHRLVEFMPELEGINFVVEPSSQQPHLIDQFIEFFEHHSGEHGLQLVWTGRGTWQLAPEVNLDSIQQNGRLAYENWLRNHPEFLTGVGNQKRHEEAQRWVHHVIRLYDDMINSQQPDDQMRSALARHYLERLMDVIRVVEARGDKPAKEWLDAAQHLKRLV